MNSKIVQQKVNNHPPIPAQLKKGLARAFGKFDQYQISKYQMRESDITLRDCLFLVHANPTKNETRDVAKMPAVYKQLANKELAAPDNTWEKRSSSGEDQAVLFTDLIKNRKLGALAMLRNLRSMREAGVTDATIREGLKSMKTEKVLPFRFITAARYAPNFEPELEEAMFRCLAEEEKLPGTTVLLIDVSGSMDSPISDKSELTRINAACGLAILAREICEHVKVFSFSTQTVAVPPRRGFALAEAIAKSQDHGGTYLGQAVQSISGLEHDRLIVFSDEQSHDTVPNPKAKHSYMINVASYKNGVGYTGNWTHVTGFSEATLKYISAYESSCTMSSGTTVNSSIHQYD